MRGHKRGKSSRHRGSMLVEDRKSTRLNSSHLGISYAVFCLKKKFHRESHLVSRKSRWPFPIGSGAPDRNHCREDFILGSFFLRIRRPPEFTLFPQTAIFG